MDGSEAACICTDFGRLGPDRNSKEISFFEVLHYLFWGAEPLKASSFSLDVLNGDLWLKFLFQNIVLYIFTTTSILIQHSIEIYYIKVILWAFKSRRRPWLSVGPVWLDHVPNATPKREWNVVDGPIAHWVKDLIWQFRPPESQYKYKPPHPPEPEFMNVQFRWVWFLKRFPYTMFTLQTSFNPLLHKGGGGAGE